MSFSSSGNSLRVGIGCLSSLGGSSRAAVRLANALDRRGHRVTLFTPRGTIWPLAPGVTHLQCDCETCPTDVPLHAAWSSRERDRFLAMIVDSLDENSLDLLHFHYALPFAAMISELKNRLGIAAPRMICTLHGTDLTDCIENAPSLSDLQRDLSSATAVATVSTFMKSLCARFLPGLTSIDVLPNFVEDEWPRSAREAPSGNRPVILHVTNFRTAKGTPVLFEIILKLRRLLDVTWLLIGDGPEAEALRERLGNASVDHDVQFLGPLPRPEDYFCQADLLVSTSRHESFGIAILEAMASGVPVVAPSIGGIPELVEDGVTGVLYDPPDTDGAVDRIARLLGDPRRAEMMGSRAYERSLGFRASNVTERYEARYSEVLDRRCGT